MVADTPVFSALEDVTQVELNMLVSALRSWSSAFQALLGVAGAVMNPAPAFSPVAGTPIQFSYTAFNAFINGYWFGMGAGTAAFTNGDGSFPRYDLIELVMSQPSGADSAGNAKITDTGTVTVKPGVASSSPTLPALDANATQVGWVSVPAGATTASQCTVHPTPGQLANTVTDFSNHILASILSGPVHGAQAGAAGAAAISQLLQGGSRGGTGALEPGAKLFAGMMAPAGQDGYLSVGSNGNTGDPNADGVYVEAAGASGSGAVNTRKVIRFTGIGAALADLIQLYAAQVTMPGSLAVSGTITSGGSPVATAASTVAGATTAGTATNANNFGGLPPSSYVQKDGSGRAPEASGLRGLALAYGVSAGFTSQQQGINQVNFTLNDPGFTPIIAIPGIFKPGGDTQGPFVNKYAAVGSVINYGTGFVTVEYNNYDKQFSGTAWVLCIGVASP